VNGYLIEITQQQIILVNVIASDDSEPIELVHSQQGEVCCLLPPGLVDENTKIIKCELNVSA